MQINHIEVPIGICLTLYFKIHHEEKTQLKRTINISPARGKKSLLNKRLKEPRKVSYSR